MSGLRTISTIFATATGLDTEQTTTLHVLAVPMPQMNDPTLRNQIEQRLMIERAELSKFHRNDAMFSRESKIGNRKLIHPLAAVRDENRQLIHHELRFTGGSNHVRAGRAIPFLRHALTGMAAPTPDVRVMCEIAPID